MKNQQDTLKSGNLSASRHRGGGDKGHSMATAAPSTSSYQSGAEYAGGYSSIVDSQSLGTAPVSLDLNIPGQDRGGVHVSVATTFAGASGPNERLVACHRYSRVVRVLAVLDAVVVLCGASAFTPLILMIWGPIAGFLSSNFQLRASYAFLFYYGLRVSWDVGWLVGGGTTWIVVWVFLFTDVAALLLIYFYLALLRRCTAAEVEQLRDPNTARASAFFPLAVSGAPPPGETVD